MVDCAATETSLRGGASLKGVGMATEKRDYRGGQDGEAGDFLKERGNQVGGIVCFTSPKSATITVGGQVRHYGFMRRGKQRRPTWHFCGLMDANGRLHFKAKVPAANYKLSLPYCDPKDGELFDKAFKQHVTNTRDFRQGYKEKTILARGAPHCAMANWVIEQKGVDQPHCLFAPNAVAFSPTKVRYNYSTISAARAMLLETQGRPAKDDMVTRHKCGMGHMSCVNPAHLCWGTAKDNSADTKLHNGKKYQVSDYDKEVLASAKDASGLLKLVSFETGVSARLISLMKDTA